MKIPTTHPTDIISHFIWTRQFSTRTKLKRTKQETFTILTDGTLSKMLLQNKWPEFYKYEILADCKKAHLRFFYKESSSRNILIRILIQHFLYYKYCLHVQRGWNERRMKREGKKCLETMDSSLTHSLLTH